jgi:hypothetical protein
MMNRRSLRRRIAAVLLCVGITAVAMAATVVVGSASGEVPTKAPSQVDAPPPPGSGVVVIVGAPDDEPLPVTPDASQPVGPRSLT